MESHLVITTTSLTDQELLQGSLPANLKSILYHWLLKEKSFNVQLL